MSTIPADPRHERAIKAAETIVKKYWERTNRKPGAEAHLSERDRVAFAAGIILAVWDSTRDAKVPS